MTYDPSYLSPDEYLRRLNAQTSPPTPVEAPSSPGSFEMKPGQTLREVLTAQELLGLRAFSLRMGLTEAEAEASFDEPYDPSSITDLEEMSYDGYSRGLDRAPSQPTPIHKANKPGFFVAFLLAVVLIVGLVLFAAFSSDSREDDQINSLKDAKGAGLERGNEAVSVVDDLTTPEEWRPEGKPELSISGNDEEAYAFYEKNFTASNDYSAAKAREWFVNLPIVKENVDESSCEDDLGRGSLTCEVDLYSYGPDGYPDYDQARRKLTLSYHPPMPASGSPDAGLQLEGYSTR